MTAPPQPLEPPALPEPPDVQALAGEKALGRLVSVTKPTERPARVVIWLIVGLIPFVFFGVTGPYGTLVVCPFFFGLAIVHLMRSPWFAKGFAARRIYVYERGFVHANPRRVRIFERGFAHAKPRHSLEPYPFDEITDFQVYRTTRGKRSKTTCMIFAADYRKLYLDDSWDTPTVVKALGAHTVQVRLPAARAALQKGETLTFFGKLIVDAHGVTGPRGSALWSEIEVVAGPRGLVVILGSNDFLPLLVKRARHLPNLQLFGLLCRVYQRSSTQGAAAPRQAAPPRL